MDRRLDCVLGGSASGVEGFLCVDSNGLCISAKKELNASHAGRVAQIMQLASDLGEEQASPVVVIESEGGKQLLIKEYDSMVVCLSYSIN